MKLTRISNAGLLVEAQGRRFLLDGLHGPNVPPYWGMDPAWERALFGVAPPIDVLAFTHGHPDHFDPGRTARYLAGHPQTLVYAGPDVLSLLAERHINKSRLLPWEEPGPPGLSSFPTRHIGPAYRDTPHRALVLREDKTLLFSGDASPVSANFLPGIAPEQPDILAAPFSFMLGNAPFRLIEKAIRPAALCILHLPPPQDDPEGLWQRARQGAAALSLDTILMELGEEIDFA